MKPTIKFELVRDMDSSSGRYNSLKPFLWNGTQKKWVLLNINDFPVEKQGEIIQAVGSAAEQSLFVRPEYGSREFEIIGFNGICETTSCLTWKIRLGDGSEINAMAEDVFVYPLCESKEDAIQMICEFVIKNYDEISDHDEPYVSLDLSGYELPLDCLGYESDDTRTPDVFIDELWGNLDDVKKGYGLVIGLSRPFKNPEDGCERVDEANLEDVSFDFLKYILPIVIRHKGTHYGK